MNHNQLIAAKFSIENKTSKWNVGGTNPDSITQTENVISAVIGFLTIFAVIYFTIQIILAGYAFISAQGEPDKVKKARHQLTQSVTGIAIIIVATGLVSFLTNYLGLASVFNLTEVFNIIGL